MRIDFWHDCLLAVSLDLLTISFNNGHYKQAVQECYCCITCLEDNIEGFVFLHFSGSWVREDVEWDA